MHLRSSLIYLWTQPAITHTTIIPSRHLRYFFKEKNAKYTDYTQLQIYILGQSKMHRCCMYVQSIPYPLTPTHIRHSLARPLQEMRKASVQCGVRPGRLCYGEVFQDAERSEDRFQLVYLLTGPGWLDNSPANCPVTLCVG